MHQHVPVKEAFAGARSHAAVRQRAAGALALRHAAAEAAQAAREVVVPRAL
jgi:hypothetical protein